jgi:thiosulfate/3-mercaptopyruvate sulfurtransferase
MADVTRDPVISTAWLSERLDDPDIAIVDATWFMPGTDRDARAEFRDGHIPGAGFFAIDEVCDRTSDLPHMLASGEQFTEAMRALGVNANSKVVVYDAQGLFSAPRLWWNLRAMGHEASYVLDGGLPAWVAEGRPVASGHPNIAPGDFMARPVADLVRDRTQVSAALETGAAQLVDARPAARFAGHAPEPRAGVRAGHMPGAMNTPFALAVENGRLAPAERLEILFTDAGVDLAAPIITTCGSGISASLLALALARLGRFDVAVYDGSWTEWGGARDTPVMQDPLPAP